MSTSSSQPQPMTPQQQQQLPQAADIVSSPSNSSLLDSSTFYSMADAESANASPNRSSAANDTTIGSMFSAADELPSDSSLLSDRGRIAADRTLTAASQRNQSLNFILEEAKRQVPAPNGAPAAAAPEQPKAPASDDVVDKPLVQLPQPPPRPSITQTATTATPVTVDDSSVIVLDESTIIELSSDSEDDPSSDTSVRTNDGGGSTLTDASLDSGELPADNENADADASTPLVAEAAQAADAATVRARDVEVKMYKTVGEFERNLPKTVTLLQTPEGSKVYVVGTAHFSRESMDDVSLVIRNVRPDVVMVELCPSRIHILKHDEKTLLEEASNINLAAVRNIIRQNGLINGLFYIVLLKVSAKLTQELGMAPGGEFRRALEEVHLLENCILHLGDRPINITLKRAMHGLSMWQSLKIVWRLATSDEKISKEDVERCKEADMIEELMNEMAGEYPEFRTVFVTERDLYLCHSLQVAATQQVAMGAGRVRPATVVGVVGIGHMAGITQHWGKVNVDRIPEITTIPQPSRGSRAVKFAIKWTVVGAIGYGIYRAVGSPRLLPAKLPSW